MRSVWCLVLSAWCLVSGALDALACTGFYVGKEVSAVGDDAKKAIEVATQGVLDARAAHPGQTLADLYDPLYMPPDLLKAHQHLDALVDKAYGKKFANDAERVAHLFDLYAAAVKEK